MLDKAVIGALAGALLVGGILYGSTSVIGDEIAISPVVTLLENKTAEERATIKGGELSKIQSVGTHENVEYGITIEIIETKKIDKGVEVFAKAWKGEKQLGFGKDGSVEIERFVIINPPILVRDAQGEIVREYEDATTGKIEQMRFREDLTEALVESLTHTIAIVGKEDTNIEKGKTGNTTTTVYPDAHVESDSVDGFSFYHVEATAGEAFSTNRNRDPGNDSDDSGATLKIQITRGQSDVGNAREIVRMFMLFDTSGIGGDSVDSATLSLYGISANNGAGYNPDIKLGIYASTPDVNTVVDSDDYANVGTTAFSDTTYNTTEWTADTYNNFALNASGVSAIDTGGISKFGGRDVSYDAPNTTPTVGPNWANSNIQSSAADEAGTTQDPKLVIEHTASAEEDPDIVQTILFGDW